MDGKFRPKPYKNYPGDNSFPDYYHARWMEEVELVDTIDKLTCLASMMEKEMNYRIVQLNIKFEKRGTSTVPTWTSKVIGCW
jgi:hypothetical protein